MHQDNLRSAVYKSLVRCDDPNGVVECGTIRKSKIRFQKMEHKNKSRRTQKDLNPSLTCKEDKKERVPQGVKEEVHNPPPFHLLEVSRGVQKLNHTVDSWSSGTSFDWQSKDIARDLLRGALDLQESLNVLCKLQEASKDMAQLKKKQKLKPERGLCNEVGNEKIDSDRFVEKSYQKGLQNPRLSDAGSSRDCIEELKIVIRESLARQNLLPVHSTEGKACLGLGKLDLVSNIPSTSSSQSSMVHSNNSVPADQSNCSTTQQKKAKATNVIAKLMGLEEIPSEPIQIAPKLPERRKNSNQWRPVFNIEMPKARSPSFVDRNEDPERRTLKEIIETMQLKGLLKHHDVEGLKLQSRLLDTSHSKQRLDHEMPPIVIMKPLHFPSGEIEGTMPGQFSQREGALYLKNIRRLEIQEEPLNKRFIKEKEILEYDKMLGKLEAKQESMAETFIQDENTLDHEEMARKVKAKEEAETKTLTQDQNAVDLEDRIQKVEAKEVTPTKRFTREEGASKSKQKLRKQEEKELKTTERASPCKMKASVPPIHKPQKKEMTNKKANIIEKVPLNRKNPVEKENAKSVTVPRTRDQIQAISKKLKKPEDGSILTKNRIRRQESTTRVPILKRSIQPISHKSIDRTKKNRTTKANQMAEALAINLITDSLQCENGDKEIEMADKLDSISTATNSSHADQTPTEERTETSQVQNEDHSKDNQTSLFGVAMQIIERDSGAKPAEESKQLLDQRTTSKKTAQTEINLKELLLNSPSFISCAEDFFDIKMNQTPIFQTTGFQEIDIVNTRIIMDCANELLERKSQLRSEMAHLWTHATVLRTAITIDQLLEEVCDGVEVLRSYSKVGDNVLPIDSIYKMLQSDLKWKGMQFSCVWDLAWVKEFSPSEADQVVSEVEKLVLSGLIEEIIIDFPNNIYSVST